MKKFKILTFLFLLIINSCAKNPLVPVRGPESDPGQELNFSEFNDFPIPINSKLIKDQSIIIAKKCSFYLKPTKLTLPKFTNSENVSEDIILCDLSKKGLNKRLHENSNS